MEEIVNWYKAVLQKYAEFSGRARRKEFWMFFLGNVIIGVVLCILGIIPFIGIIFAIVSGIFGLAVLVPTIAVGARRLHDTNRSGLLLLLWLIPLVGFIIVLIFLAQEGIPGDNQYGSNPKGA
ncbi:membrane protein [Spirochaetia bacterium]|nr:membrane protein [Spirochaetia bacterium]